MKQRILRLLVRCGFFALAVALALPLVPWPTAVVLVPAASPLVMLAATIATRSFGAVALIGLPVLLLTLVRRRWFCRWVCPVGLMTEQIGRLTATKRRDDARDTRGGLALLNPRHPRHARWRSIAHWPPLGQWMVWIILAGAALGYPVLLWLDPLTLFSSFFGVFWAPVQTASLLLGIGLPLVLLLSAVWPGAWCAKVCPLGASQDLLSLPGRMISRRWAAWREQSSTDSSTDLSTPGAGLRLARRAVLAAGVGVAWAWWLKRSAANAAADTSQSSGVIRPPGSVAAEQFNSLCIRCGNCMRTCPATILHPDLGEQGIGALLTPVVRFEQDYCREDCHRCTEVCPSGAIARLTLDEKKVTPMGLAVVDMELCIINEAECGACVSACSYKAMKTGWDDETYMVRIDVDADLCPGCGACLVVCPTEPEKAIVVRPV